MKENKKENKKGIVSFVLALAIITTVAYFIYTVINSGNLVNQLATIIGVSLITIFSILFFFTGMTTNEKGKRYTIIGALLLTGYSGFQLLTDMEILQLPKQSYVEDFTGKASVEAVKWAQENEITIKQSFENSDNVEEYYVISQDVEPGTLSKKIDEMNITVSDGPDLEKEVVIPNMIGWKAEDVLDFIKKNHLSNVEVEFIISDKTKDTVIEQQGSGTMKRNDYIKLIFSIGTEDDIQPTKMIDLTNKSKFEATFWLKQHAIKYEEATDYSNTIKRDHIMKQSIEENKTVDPTKDTVTITVSKGSKITVPDLMNMSLTEITEWITQNRLKIELSDRYDESIKMNMPIEVNYQEGDVIEEGTIIKVVISKGKLTMESFSSLAEFKTWADQYGIKYNEVYEFSDSVAQGEIIKWSHNKGDTIQNNDAITVTISQGKKTTIPNFVGKTKSYITKQCNELNLSCSFIYRYNNNVEKNVATAQSKAAGSEVSENTFLSITLSNGKAPSGSSSSGGSSGSNNDSGGNTDTPTTPTCDRSKTVQVWLEFGNSYDDTVNMLKNRYGDIKWNIVATDPGYGNNGDFTKESVEQYDGKYVNYCDTYTIYIIKK